MNATAPGDLPPFERPRGAPVGVLSTFRFTRADLRWLAGGIAFLAALELLVGGVVLPAIRQPLEGRPIVYWASVLASFSRNLAAILAVVVATLYVVSLVRDPDFARPSRRLALAVLGILTLPVLALALFVQVTSQMVFMAYTGAFFLSVLAVLTAAQWPGQAGMRAGAALTLAPAAAAFFSTLVSRFAADDGTSPVGLLFLRSLDLGGEALVLGTSMLLPLLCVRRAARTLSRPPALLALMLSLFPAAAYLAVRIYGGDRVSEVTQATLGIELAFWPPLYLAALFSFSFTVLVNLVPSNSPARRGIPELGLGLVLVASAGQDAHTPFRIVLLQLGFLLLTGGVLEARTRSFSGPTA